MMTVARAIAAAVVTHQLVEIVAIVASKEIAATVADNEHSELAALSSALSLLNVAGPCGTDIPRLASKDLEEIKTDYSFLKDIKGFKGKVCLDDLTALDTFPSINDKGYFSRGPWRSCLRAAVKYERTHPWSTEERFKAQGPTGLVVDLFIERILDAEDKLEVCLKGEADQQLHTKKDKQTKLEVTIKNMKNFETFAEDKFVEGMKRATEADDVKVVNVEFLYAFSMAVDVDKVELSELSLSEADLRKAIARVNGAYSAKLGPSQVTLTANGTNVVATIVAPELGSALKVQNVAKTGLAEALVNHFAKLRIPVDIPLPASTPAKLAVQVETDVDGGEFLAQLPIQGLAQRTADSLGASVSVKILKRPVTPPAEWISCGGHHALSCADCPQGHGADWCNGICTWKNNECVASDEAPDKKVLNETTQTKKVPDEAVLGKEVPDKQVQVISYPKMQKLLLNGQQTNNLPDEEFPTKSYNVRDEAVRGKKVPVAQVRLDGQQPRSGGFLGARSAEQLLGETSRLEGLFGAHTQHRRTPGGLAGVLGGQGPFRGLRGGQPMFQTVPSNRRDDLQRLLERVRQAGLHQVSLLEAELQ